MEVDEMNTEIRQLRSSKPLNALSAIVLAGLLSGTLDGTAAVIQYVITRGGSPVRVFVYIASGVFGREAFSRGISIALWGVVFHYLIAFSWTVAFFILYPRIKALAGNRVITGLLYGLVIWLVMNLVVLPLSNVRPPPFDPVRVVMGIAILMLCVGLPIVWLISGYYAGRDATVKANR
jgi:hypothetical protein